MPEVSRFYGIITYIFYNDHQPPHFHAVYGEFGAVVAIDTLNVIAGNIPPRALGLVVEWASIHQKELARVWKQAMNHQKLDKIEPLK